MIAITLPLKAEPGDIIEVTVSKPAVSGSSYGESKSLLKFTMPEHIDPVNLSIMENIKPHVANLIGGING